MTFQEAYDILVPLATGGFCITVDVWRHEYEFLSGNEKYSREIIFRVWLCQSRKYFEDKTLEAAVEKARRFLDSSGCEVVDKAKVNELVGAL